MKRYCLSLLGLFATLSLAGCGAKAEEPSPAPKPPPPPLGQASQSPPPCAAPAVPARPFPNTAPHAVPRALRPARGGELL